MPDDFLPVTIGSSPSGPRPEPVLDAARLGGLVSAATTAVIGAASTVVAAIHGQGTDGVGLAVGLALTALLSLVVYVAPYVTARQARQQVTPLVAPVTSDGVALITDLPGQHAADRAR